MDTMDAAFLTDFFYKIIRRWIKPAGLDPACLNPMGGINRMEQSYHLFTERTEIDHNAC